MHIIDHEQERELDELMERQAGKALAFLLVACGVVAAVGGVMLWL